ncbi:MAG: ChaN family lipoprotein [Crocinitomicaceae bacterium]
MKNVKRLLAIFSLFYLLNTTVAYSQNSTPYVLVNFKGKKTSWKKLIKQMNQSDVIFFGEEHNCVMAHWLTKQLLLEWTKTDSLNKSFVLEMFERDQQSSLDSLIQGKFELKDLPKHTATWSNYETDYSPFLELALQKKMPIVASNIPRKYASLLFKQNRDSLKALPQEERNYICPLDFPVDRELSQYKQLIEMEQHMSGKNFVEAQAIKDATMAESVFKELKKGNKVFHLNGSYHSDFQQSILWYLEYYKPGSKTVTISIVRQDGKKLSDEMKGRADFIFVIPVDFPVSYEN